MHLYKYRLLLSELGLVRVAQWLALLSGTRDQVSTMALRWIYMSPLCHRGVFSPQSKNMLMLIAIIRIAVGVNGV